MNLILEKITVDKIDILYKLLQYLLFEEILNDENDINDEGSYEYKYFDSYFIDDDRVAFFIKNEETNKLLAFVMI